MKKTNSNTLNLLLKSGDNDSNYRWLIIDSTGKKAYDTLLRGAGGKIVQLAFNDAADGFFCLEDLQEGGSFFFLID